MANFGVRRGKPARQVGALEEMMQVRGNFLQGEIVVFVAMSAAKVIKVLPFLLLRGERGRRMAAGQEYAKPGRYSGPNQRPAAAHSVA